MSLMKYFGEQSDDHLGHLFWSKALGGIPFRGQSAPILAGDEIMDKVEVHWDFKFHEFDLADEEDKKYYQYVMDRAVNQWFQIQHREHTKDETTGRIRFVYVEWAQPYGQLTPEAHANRGLQDGQ
jgi:hypothetical protein